MNYKARKAGSIVLGLISAFGTIATAILVAKETPKALDKIKELKTKKDVKKIDYIKELIPVYWPSGVICLGTIASTTISHVISLKTEASLIATSTMLSQGWNRYKGKVKDIFGIKADKLITNSVSKDEYKEKIPEIASNDKLYFEEHIGFFSCKEKDLLTALTDLNQRLHTPDPDPEGTFYWTSLYFLLKDAKAKVYDKTKEEAVKAIGWTTDYLCEAYDLQCMWVHPYFSNIVDRETGEVLYTKIDFWEDPIFLAESERSRYHYKSREDYEHEAEIDMHDADAFALYSYGYQDDIPDEEISGNICLKSMLDSKIDCEQVNDDGRRFQPSNMDGVSHIVYLDENEDLPRGDSIPKV